MIIDCLYCGGHHVLTETYESRVFVCPSLTLTVPGPNDWLTTPSNVQGMVVDIWSLGDIPMGASFIPSAIPNIEILESIRGRLGTPRLTYEFEREVEEDIAAGRREP